MGGQIEIPKELLQKLHGARHVAVLTGAGISAESGVPTFRKAQTGLWEKYDPQELATPQAFQHPLDGFCADWRSWHAAATDDKQLKRNIGYGCVKHAARPQGITLKQHTTVKALHKPACGLYWCRKRPFSIY